VGYHSFKQNTEEQYKEQKLLITLLLQQSYHSFKQHMANEDKKQEPLGSLLLKLNYTFYKQNVIQHRNSRARCACNKIIFYSNRTWDSRIRNRKFRHHIQTDASRETPHLMMERFLSRKHTL
jgi:hypothetical protein